MLTIMTYSEAIDYLYSSQPAFHLIGAAAYKPGLENTYRLMAHLGNPHERLRCIHIAGTNGKGSTSHLIAAALQAAGLRVGLYTSPHLVDFRERIRINGAMIPEQEVADFVTTHRAFLDELKPSFFETTMALAFAYFAEQQVDIAVIEVGLGGRLDSTNIITPILSVITNIGLDHTEFLGTTLPAIAGEKAGIIKSGVPVVIGETDPETASVFTTRAKALHSPIIFADQKPTNPITECELRGQYQSKNIQTAYTALHTFARHPTDTRPTVVTPLPPLSEEAIAEGFAHVCRLTGLRGRWETLRHQPLTICDTGHNSHGIRTYVEQLRALMTDSFSGVTSASDAARRLHIIYGMVSDKDVETVLSLLPGEATYYFTEAATHRAIPAAEMLRMGELHGLHGHAYPTVAAAIAEAQKSATDKDIIFIGGSNYIVGEALQILG